MKTLGFQAIGKGACGCVDASHRRFTTPSYHSSYFNVISKPLKANDHWLGASYIQF